MTTHKLGLIFSLTLYFAFGLAYSIFIPLNSGPDEMAHFIYMSFIADQHRLPRTHEERAEAAYKSDLPPLYHLLVALPNAWVDPHTAPTLKRVTDSPRRQLITRNKDIWNIYHTEDEYIFPYRGDYLRWHIGRWISLLCGAGMVYFTWLTARRIWPDNPFLVTTATLGLATLPMFTFTSAMMNYESLQGLLTALALWWLMAIANRQDSHYKVLNLIMAKFTLQLFILGFIIGLAIITKYSAILLPLEAIIILTILSRPSPFSRLSRSSFAFFVFGLAIPVSLWLGFIWGHFNNITELGWFMGSLHAIIGSDKSDQTTTFLMSWLSSDNPTTINSLNHEPWWRWLLTFYSSMLVVNVPQYGWVWSWALIPTAALGLSALLGLAQLWQRNSTVRPQLTLLLLHVAVFLPLPLIRFAVTGNVSDTGQGRHLLFPAASALAILFVWGISELGIRNYELGIKTYSLLLIFWNIQQLTVMTHAYPAPLPVQTVPTATQQAQHRLDKVMAENLTLIGYNDPQIVNESLQIELIWQATGIIPTDYLTELSLVSTATHTVSQWLGHPLNGRYPTRAWDAGDVVRDTIKLPLHEVTAGNYTIILHLLTTNTLQPIITEILLTPYSLLPTPPLPPTSYLLPPTPNYHYRQTITVISPDPQSITLQHDDNVWKPLRVVGTTALFIVGARWPSGLYQLHAPDRTMTVTIENEWDRNFNLPPIQHPAQANFANQLYFLGYDLPPMPLKPGQPFPITLYWQAPPDKAPQADFIQFNHLHDGVGKLYGGHDRIPLENYSTLLWAAGEIIADGYTLTIDPAAPTGTYYLDVGYYLTVGESAVNLPLVINGAMSDQNHITIELQVEH